MNLPEKTRNPNLKLTLGLKKSQEQKHLKLRNYSPVSN